MTNPTHGGLNSTRIGGNGEYEVTKSMYDKEDEYRALEFRNQEDANEDEAMRIKADREDTALELSKESLLDPEVISDVVLACNGNKKSALEQLGLMEPPKPFAVEQLCEMEPPKPPNNRDLRLAARNGRGPSSQVFGSGPEKITRKSVGPDPERTTTEKITMAMCSIKTQVGREGQELKKQLKWAKTCGPDAEEVKAAISKQTEEYQRRRVSNMAILKQAIYRNARAMLHKAIESPRSFLGRVQLA